MFGEILKDIVERTEGGVASLLMGFDGITVDSFIRGGEESTFDVETVGMEYSVILKDVCRAAEMLETGEAREFSVKAEKMIVLVRMINDEYFVAVTLRPDGNLGKARYLLRGASNKLVADLS